MDTEDDRESWDGRIIKAGETIMRNDYSFRNSIIRTGFEMQATDVFTFRVGSQLRFYEYDYYQNNFISQTERTGKPQQKWTEIILTGGFTVNRGKYVWHYKTNIIPGNGLLESQQSWWWGTAAPPTRGWWIPFPSWRPSLGDAGRGSTWTPRMAASRSSPPGDETS